MVFVRRRYFAARAGARVLAERRRARSAALRRLPVREAVPIAGAALAADGALVLASLRGMRRLASLPIE